MVTDSNSEVLRPAKLWNDTESAPDAAELISSLPGGAADWATSCGSVPVPSFTITKLRWLRRCEPDVFRRVAAVLLPHDWLSSRLTGRRTTDRGDASGTGYWSPEEERYCPDLLDLVDDAVEWEPPSRRCCRPWPWPESGQTPGSWSLPAPATTWLRPLVSDCEPGDLVLSLGTSGTAFTVSDHPSADPSGTVAGFADATGRFLPLVCTMNATKVTDAVARLLGVDHERFDALALDAPPGAAGLVLVPYFDGERTPNRPDDTGTLIGLRSDVTPERLARAAVEGVVCNLLAGADALGPSRRTRVPRRRRGPQRGLPPRGGRPHRSGRCRTIRQ